MIEQKVFHLQGGGRSLRGYGCGLLGLGVERSRLFLRWRAGHPEGLRLKTPIDRADIQKIFPLHSAAQESMGSVLGVVEEWLDLRRRVATGKFGVDGHIGWRMAHLLHH